MPVKIQPSYTKAPKTICAIGDSQTLNFTLGVLTTDFWPEQLAVKLRSRNCRVQARNFGVSGDTSANNLSRIIQCLQYEIPYAFLIAVGVNDPGASISTAQTQSNITQCILVMQNAVAGVVAGQASLPAGIQPSTRYLVSSDTDTTGGAAANSNYGQAATVTGTLAGSPPAIWQSRGGLAGIAGWGRVANNPSLGVQNIGVVTMPYLNWTTGGDTVNTQGSTYAAVLSAQSAAATATGAVFYNVWSYMNNLISTGVETQGSNSWHYYTNNQHMNQHGHSITSDTILASMPSGWITGLQ